MMPHRPKLDTPPGQQDVDAKARLVDIVSAALAENCQVMLYCRHVGLGLVMRRCLLACALIGLQ